MATFEQEFPLEPYTHEQVEMLIAFHKAHPTPEPVYTEHTLTADELRAMDARIAAWASDVPDLGALMQYEADTAAWLKAHGTTGQDARCKACGVEYLRDELSADRLCHHCADELGEEQRFYNVSDLIDDLRSGKLGAPVAARLPLSTPVRLRSGIEGVISGHSTCDAQRYRVSWFDRALWVVRHKWTDRVNFEVIASLTAGIGVALVATPEQVQQAATSV